MLSYDPKLMAKTVPADFRHDRRLATAAAAAATTPLAEAKSESLDDVFEDEPEFDKGYQFESRCAAATCRQAEVRNGIVIRRFCLFLVSTLFRTV